MKYIFKLHSRVTLHQSAEEKHRDVINKLKLIDSPWGLPDQEIPFPGFGDHFIASSNLSKHMGQGIKCTISYRYRNKLTDSSSCDDRMYLELNTKRIDYGQLINDICPVYIQLFDAYFASIYDEDLIIQDSENSYMKNWRKDIIRFYPVYFLDNELCLKALNISANELFEKLANKIEKVDLLSNGVFIHNDSKFFTTEEANEFSKKIWNAITGIG